MLTSSRSTGSSVRRPGLPRNAAYTSGLKGTCRDRHGDLAASHQFPLQRNFRRCDPKILCGSDHSGPSQPGCTRGCEGPQPETRQPAHNCILRRRCAPRFARSVHGERDRRSLHDDARRQYRVTKRLQMHATSSSRSIDLPKRVLHASFAAEIIDRLVADGRSH